MPSQSYLTYRVRGIPDGLSQTSVKELIQRAVGSADGLEFRIKSLAKDLTRADRMVATFTLQNPPPNLPEPSGVAEQSYEVLLDSETEIELVIDTHFHGCTPLHWPNEENWRFDLIAISGLNGHAFGSFKKPGAAYMWLRDTLAQDIPESRIIIYGYDSKLQDSDSFQNVNDIGRKFQHAIREARRNSEKPLVLLGHSLGGIVIKEALHLMRTSTISEDRKIFSTINGILFFGVPNQGMDISSLIPMVANEANRGFLHTLESNSPILRMQAQQYSDAIANLRCDVVNFYETKKSPTAQKREDGSWAMTGPRAVLVDNSHSATHGRPHDSEHHRIYPIDRTHSDLVKFANAYDEAYITVLGYLRSFDIDVRSLSGSMLPSLTSSQQDCLKTLGFPEQFDRIDMLKPDNKTCDWLFSNTIFNNWLRSRNGLLWIRGNPGCGKSMSMKRTLHYLQGQSGAPRLLAHFFFHGQGSNLQKTSHGLYLSLLHQLYPHFPGCFSGLTKQFEQYHDKGPEGWRWMCGELHEFLRKGILDVSRNHPTILLLDALDEAGEGEAKSIANDLKKLMAAAEHENSQLRICFSCRHYPQITLSGGETLVMDEANKEDIHAVVTTRIDSAICFNGSEKDQLKSEILSKAAGNFQWAALVSDMIIETREKGDSFKVALKNLYRAPPTLELLYESLLDVKHEPRNYKQRQQMLKLFQWVAFAVRPLTLEELHQAMALDCNMSDKSISEYLARDTHMELSDLRIKVKNLSRGLVRFVEGKDGKSQAVLIHQSVVDFFVNGGLRVLTTDTVADVERLAHFQLSRSCLRYLSMTEIRQYIRDRRSPPPESWLHLFGYSWEYWALHAFRAKVKDQVNTGDSDSDLLAIFEWPNDEAFLSDWVHFSEKYTHEHPLEYLLKYLHPHLLPEDRPYSIQWPNRGLRLVHVLAFLGLQSPLESLAAQDRFPSIRHFWDEKFNVTDDTGKSPLIYAFLGNQKKTVQFLMQVGAKLNPKRGREWTLLTLASQNPDPEFIKMLFPEGAKINTGVEGTSALHFAIDSGNLTAMKMLLDSGVNVEARKHTSMPLSIKYNPLRSITDNLDRCGATPLHRAAQSGNEASLKMLLDRGANVHAPDTEGTEPLAYAFWFLQEPLKVALTLLDHGADLDTSLEVRDRITFDEISIRSRGRYMHLVGSERSHDHLQILTPHENLQHNISTPIGFAVKTGDKILLKNLLDRGANTHVKDFSNISPLYYTALFGRWEMFKMILNSGADPNSRERDGNTPLHLAARKGDLSIVASLVESGALPEAKNDMGKTPFDIAVQRGNMEIIELFVSAGCDIEARSGRRDGKPSLHLAATAPNGDAVSFLIQKGADVNTICPRGTSALHWAETSEAVERLTAAGLKIDPRDCMGCTPLHFAANRGNAKVVAMLLKKGADAIIDAKSLLGETALHLAASSKVVELLVEAGANLESRDRWGRTPLYYAAQRQALPVVFAEYQQGCIVTRILGQKGADENVVDCIGDSVFSNKPKSLMPPPPYTTGPDSVG